MADKEIMDILKTIVDNMATKDDLRELKVEISRDVAKELGTVMDGVTKMIADNHTAVMNEMQVLKMDQSILHGIIQDNYATRRFEARLAMVEDELEELKRKIG